MRPIHFSPCTYCMAINPYQSPTTDSDSGSRSRATMLELVGWFYPLLLLGSFYGTWLVAWINLGQMPRPSLDDPKSIGISVDIAYLITVLLLVGFPVAAVIGVGIQLSAVNRPLQLRLGLALLIFLIWVGVLLLIRWDPFLVSDWFFD